MLDKWALPATIDQTEAIFRLRRALRIREYLEDTVSNRYEARSMIYDLRNELKLRRNNG